MIIKKISTLVNVAFTLTAAQKSSGTANGFLIPIWFLKYLNKHDYKLVS